MLDYRFQSRCGGHLQYYWEMCMLDFRVQSLCGGYLQLILLIGDVYVGL